MILMPFSVLALAGAIWLGPRPPHAAGPSPPTPAPAPAPAPPAPAPPPDAVRAGSVEIKAPGIYLVKVHAGTVDGATFLRFPAAGTFPVSVEASAGTGQ
jgi:hypothetical protein